jgi:hypothetical protein
MRLVNVKIGVIHHGDALSLVHILKKAALQSTESCAEKDEAQIAELLLRKLYIHKLD